MTVNDVFVVNVAEGRGHSATQLGAFNGYTADLHWMVTPMLILTLHLTVHILRAAVETTPGGWWTWAHNMSFAVSPSTAQTEPQVCAFTGHERSFSTYSVLWNIAGYYVDTRMCLHLYGWHKLLHFQDEYALGYISIQVSDSADISDHTESQECAKWDEERFPRSTSQNLSCTSVLEGRYVSIRRTDGENYT